jgi:hypothetical protein
MAAWQEQSHPPLSCKAIREDLQPVYGFKTFRALISTIITTNNFLTDVNISLKQQRKKTEKTCERLIQTPHQIFFEVFLVCLLSLGWIGWRKYWLIVPQLLREESSWTGDFRMKSREYLKLGVTQSHWSGSKNLLGACFIWWLTFITATTRGAIQKRICYKKNLSSRSISSRCREDAKD